MEKTCRLVHIPYRENNRGPNQEECNAVECPDSCTRQSPSLLGESMGGWTTIGLLPQGGGGDLVQTMPRCVCPKVKDMGPFSASSE